MVMPHALQLRTLYLDGGAEGARALVAAQPHAPQLHTQDLYENSIGVEGPTTQAAVLPHASQPQT